MKTLVQALVAFATGTIICSAYILGVNPDPPLWKYAFAVFIAFAISIFLLMEIDRNWQSEG